MPRMTTLERTAIATPASGLQVYDTTTNTQWYYNGTAWVEGVSAAMGSKWTNDATNTLVKLTTLSDGNTIRPVGSEFVIKDNGNMGFGTSSPNVEGWSNSSKVFTFTANDLVSLTNTNTVFELVGRRTSGNFGIINFISNNGSGTNTTVGRLLVESESGGLPDGGDMTFYTKHTGVAESAKMKIMGSGNVGIGTTEPNVKLHIRGNETNYTAFSIENGTASKTWSLLSVGSAGFNTAVAGDLVFNQSVNGNAAIIKNTTGYFGLGTDTPSERLEVNGGVKSINVFATNNVIAGVDVTATSRVLASNYIRINASTSNVNSPYISFYNLGVSEISIGQSADKNFHISRGQGVASSTALLTVLHDDGKVGIGTTAPTSKLQVVGLPVHASNTAATTAGLTAGAFYHNGDGVVRVVF